MMHGQKNIKLRLSTMLTGFWSIWTYWSRE